MLRKSMPEAEVILWSRLRRRQLCGCKFRRQYGVGKFSIDFYCPELKLAIEVDGESHRSESAEISDRAREEFIGHFGIQFLRFSNTDVRMNLNGVLLKTKETIRALMQNGRLTCSPPAVLTNEPRPPS
jgi:very-short-patch-repair endonuclease